MPKDSMSTGEPEQTATMPDSAQVARTIGNYRLLQRIGEGGMGEVWEAEQLRPVQRKVALKLIKRGMDSELVLARFETERQALALMEHPAIAKVFDAGTTERGRPFFVMEHVRGVAITEYCDRHRMTVRERLKLFIQVCEGIQHAHQKAIIHRDIKPSNILVAEQDGQPVPKVIDFGVAKATAQRLTERTLFTELGQLIGTPEYMSPEQAELTGEDIDIRTDVYALGMVLYELLAGALPFDPKELRKAGLVELQRKIREYEPPKPSTQLTRLSETAATSAKNRRTSVPALARSLHGDLDWIVMKALDKDRGRRYETAHAFASDVARFLRNEAVEATPPSTAYRVRKFVARHRMGVTAAVIVLLALVVGVAGTTIGLVRATRAEARASDEAEKASTIKDFLTTMLSSANPEKEKGREMTVRQVLDEASDGVEGAFTDKPQLEAGVRATLGLVYLELGHYEEAERHLDRAGALHRRSGSGNSLDANRARNDLARVYFHQRRYSEAANIWREGLQTARRLLGDENPQTLTMLHNLGAVLLAQEDLDQAERFIVEAYEGRRKVLGEEDSKTMASAGNLATLYERQGRYSAAEPLHARALEVRSNLLGAAHPRTLVSAFNLGNNYEQQERYEQAEEHLVQALEGFTTVLGGDHPYTLLAMHELASLLAETKRLEEAEQLALGCYESRLQRYGQDASQTRETAELLASIYTALQDEARAALWAKKLPDPDRDPL